MQVITKDEFLLNPFRYAKILADKVFIYPTDTIYGIGCDATDEALVRRIRKIKGSTHPFSIIAPAMEWIGQHCQGTEEAAVWLDKLPGPYTLIFTLKTDGAVAPSVSNTGSLGIRIPNHWFSQVVTRLGFPIITTSANKVGQDFMTSLEDLDPDIANQVDYIIYEGEKDSSPSTLVHLDKQAIEVKERSP